MSFAHGGNVYEIAAQMGVSPDALVDFSASINPQGPPPGLLEEFGRCFHRLQHYPDIHNRALIEAIARFHGLPARQVVAGNGSTELIYALPGALGIQSALIVLPTFSEYQRSFASQQVAMAKLFTSAANHFQPTVEQLQAACEKTRPQAILLTHPGSPGGTALPPEVRAWLVEKSRQGRMYCIVDEVFVDFCEEESCKRAIGETDHLVLIRSMTKFYGIPGLRLGYVLAAEPLVERIERHLPPWSVNTLAQIAGVYALAQESYRAASLTFMDGERARVIGRLEKLEGCRVFPGRANYLLIELDEKLRPASRLQRDLLASERILVRDCSSFEGLDDRYVRFAIRSTAENDRLLDAFARWLEVRLEAATPPRK